MSPADPNQASPFSPRALPRQLARDAAIRWAALVAVLAVLLIAAVREEVAPNLSLLTTVLVAALWIGLNSVSAKVWRALPRITALVEHDEAAAEAGLADALRRKPLQRSARLLVYHRAAALRFRQRRFAETAAICSAVLAQKLGRASLVRGNLLLMLAESCLEIGDMPGAYAALTELHRTRLSLGESLQQMGLQTRYEVACGYDLHALHDLGRKVYFAELMPAPQAAAMHALLATAATRAKQDRLADWLNRRAWLLGAIEPQQATV